MGNDVRGLFQKINQVDLPYQSFDSEGDDLSLEVAAPAAPPIAARPSQGRQAADNVVIKPVIQTVETAMPKDKVKVFQGFAMPANEPTAPTPPVGMSGLLRKYGQTPQVSAEQTGVTVLADLFASLSRF